MGFIKNSVWGLVSVGSRLASGFCLNKVVAVYFGPAGLIQLAHFQNLLTFFILIPNDGINRGLIKYLSQFRADKQRYTHYLIASALLTLLHYALATGFILLTQKYTLVHFLVSRTWLIGIFLGAGLLISQAFLSAVLLARQAMARVVVGHLLAAGSIVLFTGLAGSYLTLPQLCMGYLLCQSLAVMYLLYYGLHGHSWLAGQVKNIPLSAYRQLGTYVLMALSVLICSKGVEYVVRDYLIRQFTLPQAGLWQGVVRLSDSYSGVYTSVLAFAFFPKIVTLVSAPDLLGPFVRRTLALVIPVLMLGLLGVYLLRHSLFTWLFSPQFLKGSYLLNYQLLGDFFKLISWLLANILVAQARVKVILWFEGISAAAYLGFVYFFTEQFGLAGSTMAHCANYAFFLALHVFYFRKLLCKRPFRWFP